MTTVDMMSGMMAQLPSPQTFVLMLQPPQLLFLPVGSHASAAPGKTNRCDRY